MMRRTTIVAVSLLLGAGLTACGSSDKSNDSSNAANSGASYCDLLKGSAKDISSFTSASGSPDFAKFNEVVDEVKKISDKAPSDVADDWKVLTDALAQMTGALSAAGTDLAAVIKAATTGQLPEGVTREQLATLGAKLQALEGSDIKTAGETISKQAKDSCGVNLK